MVLFIWSPPLWNNWISTLKNAPISNSCDQRHCIRYKKLLVWWIFIILKITQVDMGESEPISPFEHLFTNKEIYCLISQRRFIKPLCTIPLYLTHLLSRTQDFPWVYWSQYSWGLGSIRERLHRICDGFDEWLPYNFVFSSAYSSMQALWKNI